jgi:DNA-binding NarL/FixJ family response regulator
LIVSSSGVDSRLHRSTMSGRDLVLHITPWERDALELLADGTPTGVLAERFGTSEVDVKARLSTLFERMGVLGRAEAVAAALRRGLVTRTSPASGN